MKVSIYLKDKSEITTNLSDEEYQKLKQSLVGGAKMVEIENQVLSTTFISRIEPTVEQLKIAKEFRLPETATDTEKERELEAINVVKGMDGLFNRMKANGMFEGFSSYKDWEEKKYGKVLKS